MNENVVAIIQARMRSTRLPGKILADICGRPMLWHVIDRLKYSRLIGKILVATTRTREDDIVEDLCKKCGIDFYRGSEPDVLDRYYEAARINNADMIVRIAADCPLIDPVISDKVIAAYSENMDNFSGASNVINRTYPRGLDTEVFPFAVIKRTWEEAEKPYYREHVTPYIYEHKKLFKVLSVENDRNFGNLRWTVDEASDLKFVKEIYGMLYKENKIFTIKDILKALEDSPSLKNINMHVKQKAVGA